MTVKKGTVKIRMYNTEFGDCFLLGFPSKNGGPKYVLIDFGMHHSTDNKVNKLKKIARELKNATGGKIHLLVATHEHTDHIDGFKRAHKIFSKIKVENIWMGWTENYDDPKVKKLDKVKKLYMQALSIAAKELRKVRPKLGANIQSVLRFNIDEDYVFAANPNYNPENQTPSTNRETMIWLKHHGTTLKYCTPGGKPLQCDGIDDVNFYVLGPPTKKKGRLTKSAPSKGTKKETYLSDDVNDEYLKFAVDIIRADEKSDENAIEDDLRLELDKQKPFADRYEFDDQHKNVVKNYKRMSDKWRKIDDLWLDMASSLAIKLDTHTNNSSLVLAIELGDKGKVLLFPGDAQVGNWLGWGDLTWKKGNKKIKKDDLLKRTVLYKVGHHGSHNATLKKEGLEKMIHSDLTAMIPVDQKFAVKQEWEIPYSDLLKRLKSKCKQRVLRSDKKLPSKKPYNVSEADWKKFRKSIKKNNNEKYIELSIDC
ncbi:MAG: MBL fold metallo-hydrolase [Planctomycetota bacterium]